jgi:hypothetical protein
MTEDKRERSCYTPYDTHPEWNMGLESYKQMVEEEFVRAIPCPFDRNSVPAQVWTVAMNTVPTCTGGTEDTYLTGVNSD